MKVPKAIHPHRLRRVVLSAVADQTKVSPQEIMGPRRNQTTFAARAMCIAIVDELYPDMFSLPAIGALFGRDHTTIMHARDRIKALRRDPTFAAQFARASDAVRSWIDVNHGLDVEAVEARAIWIVEILATAVRNGLLNDAKADPVGFCRHYEKAFDQNAPKIHPEPLIKPGAPLPVVAPPAARRRAAAADVLLQRLRAHHEAKKASGATP